jgi:DNA-binding NarL/FixJ family response regulator
VSDRLRVFVVGVTSEDLASFRGRLARAGTFDIVGDGLVADVRRGARSIPGTIDAVLMTPRAWGRLVPVTQAVADEPMLEQLTPRERSVLVLLADGLPNREIARELEISEHTVKFHLASIFGKLGASSRTDAVRRGLRLGLIEI